MHMQLCSTWCSGPPFRSTSRPPVQQCIFRLPGRCHLHRLQCSESGATQPARSLGQAETEQDFDGLTAEEDWVVPGGSEDSLSSNTELGRAVREACDEIEHLGRLEAENLQKADELLKKLGFKGSILAPAPDHEEKGADG